MKFRIGDKEFELDQTRLMLSEIEAIERYSGEGFDALQKKAQNGYLSALKPFVWLAMRRSGENVKYSELDFDVADFEVSDDTEATEAEETPVPKGDGSAKK